MKWRGIGLLLLLLILAGAAQVFGLTPNARPESHAAEILPTPPALPTERDLDARVQVLAHLLYAPDRLPEDLRPSRPLKDATLIVRELDYLLQAASPEVREYVQGLRRANASQDICRTWLSGSEVRLVTEHFSIHYTLSGSDAVSSADADGNGLPDYVELAAEVMEYVWQVEVENLGWTPPPPDGGAGGDDRYDVYLINMPGYYGVTCADTLVGDNPESPGRVETEAYASHLALENDYAGFSGVPEQLLKVTAAHEFAHALQYGYDGQEPFVASAWLYEGVATWMEDEVYDSINDNWQFLGSILGQPGDCLSRNNSTNDSHVYGTWIFFRYLSEHVGGPDTVRRVWEEAIQYDGFVAVRRAIEAAGRTLEDVFADFAVAIALQRPCGSTPEDPYCFEEAPFDTETRVHDYLSWRGTAFSANAGLGAQQMGANFWKVTRMSPTPVLIQAILPQGTYRLRFVETDSDTVTIYDFEDAGGDPALLLQGGNSRTDILAVIHTDQPTGVQCQYSDYKLIFSPADSTPTPTATATPTVTPTPTITPTYTPTPRHTPTPTSTPTPTHTLTPTPTPTSSITPTPTPTPPPPATWPTPECSELVQNGDFESPLVDPWVEGGSHIIWSTSQNSGVQTHSGQKSAWLGGYKNANDVLYQEISIPADVDTVTLRYWVYVYSDVTDSVEGRLRVQMRAPDGTVLEDAGFWHNLHPRYTWIPLTWDLTGLRGRTVRLYFQATTTSKGITGFFVDDVSVQACKRPPIVSNGDFEQGLVAWTLDPTNDQPVTVVTDTVHSGASAIRLGEPVPNVPQTTSHAQISTTVSIPVQMAIPALRYWYRHVTNDIRAYSRFKVILVDNQGQEHLLADVGYENPHNIPPPPAYDMGWQEGVFDLSPYRGQEVTLVFRNENSHPGISLGAWTYLDDVRVVDDVPRGSWRAVLPFLVTK